MWIVLLANKPTEPPKAAAPFHLRDTDTEAGRNRKTRAHAHDVPTMCGLELPAAEIVGMAPPNAADACAPCLDAHAKREAEKARAAAEAAAEAARIADEAAKAAKEPST